MDGSGPSEQEIDQLERARTLARQGWGQVHPNPMVGCVLLRDGSVVGEGFHGTFGGPHAEVEALSVAGDRAEGATAVVTLEPCDHHGKTPPCAEALIAAGVRRVVYGARDPGAEAGGGHRTLEAAGVEVAGPLWSDDEAWAENPAFHHAARSRTPFVAVKLAVSLDGKVAAGAGERTRLTGPEADREVHRLRTGFDAIMVGARTAQIDDPLLTVRHATPGRRAPRRIVVTSDAALAGDAALLRDRDVAPVHLIARTDAPRAAVERAAGHGALVSMVEGATDGDVVDIGAALDAVRGLGVASILCEGGPRLASSLLASGSVQRLYLFVVPVVLGSRAVAAFGGSAESVDWSGFRPTQPPATFGRDTLITLDRREG